MLSVITVIFFFFAFASADDFFLPELCQAYKVSCIFMPSQDTDKIYITSSGYTRAVATLSNGDKLTEAVSTTDEQILGEVVFLTPPEDVRIRLVNVNLPFDEVIGLLEDMVEVERKGGIYLFHQKAVLVWQGVEIARGRADRILALARQKAQERQAQVLYPYTDTAEFLSLCRQFKKQCIPFQDGVMVFDDAKDLIRYADTKKKRWAIYGYILALTDEAKREIGLEVSGQGLSFKDGFLTYSLAGDISKLALSINALVQKGKAKILSQPFLVIDDGRDGSIKTGFEIPYITPATANTPPTVSFKEATLSLSVYVKYLGDDKVLMRVIASKDAPDYSRQISGNVPINTNRIQTQMTMRIGDILVLGGILEEVQSQGRRYFLFIPIGDSKQEQKTELYIFLKVEPF